MKLGETQPNNKDSDNAISELNKLRDENRRLRDENSSLKESNLKLQQDIEQLTSQLHSLH